MPDDRTRERRESGLVTVSNRLPVTLRRGPRGPERVRSSGGLVAAFEPILEDRGGLWIGWPGLELRPGESVSDGEDHYQLAPVGIPRHDVKPYYQGFSNRTLWPLFHTLPGQAVFETSEWDAYQRVNERFAEATAAAIQPDDHVIVNDYHLMLTPGYLRKLAPEVAVGFFLHIPFPPYDVFRVLPWARPLLRGLLAADLVGFHVSGYVRNFLDCTHRLLGLKTDVRRGIVQIDGRTVRVIALPLGIDFAHYESLAKGAPDAGFGNQERVVLGVDRLDYTKGIPQRIHAFARLLETHPQHRQNVTLLQLAVPSRSEVTEYKELKREIDELVGQVNGRFSSASWTPIRYLYRSVSPDKLTAMYRDAEVGFVTPLRDGRDEPGGEGIRGLSGERPRRVAAITHGRRGRDDDRGPAGKPLQHRRHSRQAAPGPRHAQGRAARPHEGAAQAGGESQRAPLGQAAGAAAGTGGEGEPVGVG